MTVAPDTNESLPFMSAPGRCLQFDRAAQSVFGEIHVHREEIALGTKQQKPHALCSRRDDLGPIMLLPPQSPGSGAVPRM